MKIAQSQIDHIQKEAQQGIVLAQYNLAWMYYTGRGLKRDYVKAAIWYQKAAEQGEVIAEFIMYTLHLKGIGVGKDIAKATEWLKKAANAGNVQAQAGLGNNYVRGTGVSKDPVMGYAWLSLAKLYGYRHWYHNITLHFLKKTLSKTQIQQSQRFITDWQEERRRKLAN